MNSAARKATTGYTVIETIVIGTKTAKQAALDFGAMLGADKGYSSRVVYVGRNVYDCVASDGRAVRFSNPSLRRVK